MLEELPDPFTFYQLIGWVPFFIFLVSFQILDPKKTIFLWMIGGSFYALHYYGLNAFIPMWISIGGIARDFVAVYGSKRQLNFAVIIYIVFAWSLCLLYGTEVHDYLVALGTTCLTFSSFNRDHFWRQRVFALGHQGSWFLAFISMGSYAGLAMIICSFFSNIIGMARYKMRASNASS